MSINHVVLIVTGIFLNIISSKRRKEVYIKRRSTFASPSLKGYDTKPTTENRCLLMYLVGITSQGHYILGDPGAVSRAGRKGATKVFKYKRKSPWVPSLTGPFPNGQANAGS